MLWFAGLRGAMAFALAMRNTVTEVRQLFFTTTCVVTISTVIFNGGLTIPILTFLEVSTSVGSGSEFFGFGFAFLAKFGFGFDRVCKF